MTKPIVTLRLLVLIPTLFMIAVGCDRLTQPGGAQFVETSTLTYHLDLKALHHFSDFPTLNQATAMAKGDQLVITSTGDDPQIAVPPMRLASAAQFAALVDITVPADGTIQLYYTTDENPGFTEAQVVTASIGAGRNCILLEINHPSLHGTMRFDPGQATGEYTIHRFEVFSSQPISLEPGTASTAK